MQVVNVSWYTLGYVTLRVMVRSKTDPKSKLLKQHVLPEARVLAIVSRFLHAHYPSAGTVFTEEIKHKYKKTYKPGLGSDATIPSLERLLEVYDITYSREKKAGLVTSEGSDENLEDNSSAPVVVEKRNWKNRCVTYSVKNDGLTNTDIMTISDTSDYTSSTSHSNSSDSSGSSNSDTTEKKERHSAEGEPSSPSHASSGTFSPDSASFDSESQDENDHSEVNVIATSVLSSTPPSLSLSSASHRTSTLSSSPSLLSPSSPSSASKFLNTNSSFSFETEKGEGKRRKKGKQLKRLNPEETIAPKSDKRKREISSPLPNKKVMNTAAEQLEL